jgi:hypothetical protein
MRIEETKRVRGLILQLLAGLPADAFLTPDLFVTLIRSSGHRTVMREDVARELRYLADKKYVELEQLRGQAAQLVGGASARILPAGRDVIEHTTNDPGIDLGAFAE